MEPKPAKPILHAAELRRVAELRMRGRRCTTGDHATDTERLVHELQVHGIELEMQNEELRLARDAMEAGLEKYSDLYDFAPVAYLTLDREGKVREVNLTATALFGIERSRLIGWSLGLSLPADDQAVLTAFLGRTFQSRTRHFCEVTLLRTGKPRTPVRIEAAATASGRECRAAMTDITESRRAERYRSILSRLEAAGSLAGGLAHDYGDLLATIQLNLELAQTLIPSGEEFLARRIEDAAHAALLAQELTRHLIALAPETTATVRTPVELSEVLHACSDAVLNGHPVRCSFLLPEDLWPVEMDVGQLGQALRHLILNARESMPHGGMITLQAENLSLQPAEAHASAPRNFVRLSISDRGEGMAETTQPRIFDPYFSTKPKANHWGRGLGLTICQAVIRKNGGTIEVESQEGVGTTFHVDLPASRRLTVESPAAPRLFRQNPSPCPHGSANASPRGSASP